MNSIILMTFLSTLLISCNVKNPNQQLNKKVAVQPLYSAAVSDLEAQAQDNAPANKFVGPNRSIKTLSALAPTLQPGDVIELDGDHTYDSVVFDGWNGQNGTEENKIIIRGVPVNGKLPIISGGTNTVHFRNAQHYVLTNVVITGGSSRCVFHQGHDITIRNSVIRDCPNHGVLGADNDSGSLTLSFIEMYNCGQGDGKHTIYMATDHAAHPGSTFRLEHSYIHSPNGGNLIKSRSERNEIYFNYLESASSGYRELELIGPDGSDDIYTEFSDVVGNTIVSGGSATLTRLGGDCTGDTNGYYRFLNNTFILINDRAVFQMLDRIDSMYMANNVFYRLGGGSVSLFTNQGTCSGSSEGRRRVAGANNWLPQGSNVPSSWLNTQLGSNPMFSQSSSASSFNPSIQSSSPLIDKGASTSVPSGSLADYWPASPETGAFIPKLAAVSYLPPVRRDANFLQRLKSPRVVLNQIDIGSNEYSSGGGTVDTSGGSGSTDTSGGSGSTDTSGGSGSTDTSGGSGSDVGGSVSTSMGVIAVTASGYEAGSTNYPQNTVDSDLSTRWSEEITDVKPYLIFEYSEAFIPQNLSISWLRSSERAYSFKLEGSNDGSSFVQLFSGTSYMSSNDFEDYSISSSSAYRFYKLTVIANSQNTWASVNEVVISGSAVSDNTGSGSSSTDTSGGSGSTDTSGGSGSTDTSGGSGSTDTGSSVPPSSGVLTVTASGFRDSRFVPENAIDNNFRTRWMEVISRVSPWILLDYPKEFRAESISISWASSNKRRYTFIVEGSADGSNFVRLYSGTSTLHRGKFEDYPLSAGNSYRFYRITVTGASSGSYANIREVKVNPAP